MWAFIFLPRAVWSSSDHLLAKLVQSILDQSYLAPFTTHIQPILPDYDHTMRLYPLPTCVRVFSSIAAFAFLFTDSMIRTP